MKILQLFFESLGRDPRPTRFYKDLSALGDVTVCASPPVKGVGGVPRFVDIAKRNVSAPQKIWRAVKLLARCYESDIWTSERQDALRSLERIPFDVIVCHDLLLMPLAKAVSRSSAARNCPIVMDAREYYPRQFEHSLLWRLVLGGLNEYLCRKYLPLASLVFTVSPGLAEGYCQEYGVSCEVLPSYPDHQDIAVHDTAHRPIRCIHHGAASPGRKLEVLLEAFRPLTGKFSLDFMLLPNNRTYLEALRRRAADVDNIRFIDPVPMPEIVATISQYDLGIFLLQPNTFNHIHCLPNKLFEFIQARLGVIVSPVQDMSKVVLDAGVGAVADGYTPEAMAKLLNSLSIDDIDRYKRNADAVADRFCWQTNSKIIREKIIGLTAA